MSNNIKTAAESARNFISGLLNKVTGTGQPDSTETAPKSNDPTNENVKIVGDREIKDAPVDPKPVPTQENPPINNNSPKVNIGGNREVKDLPPKPPTKDNQPKIEAAKRPIPVKINESDILMEGTVKSYVVDEWKWIESKLKLTVDGVLTKDDQPIEISPIHEVGPSRIVNVPGAFNLDTYHESDWKPGDLFAATALEDGEKWIRCINYARYHKINASKHEHPLDEFDRSGPCRICAKEPKKSSFYSDGLTCMFCKEGEYEICSECHPKLQEFPKDLLINTPHHPHKLMAFDKPNKLHPFSGGLGPAKLDSTVLPCNNCGKNITGRMYYCPRCDYAECLACVPVSNQPDQAIGSAPMELVVGNLKDYLKSDKPNHFKLSVNEGQRAPYRMALISNRPWNVSQIDTSPALDAYFEVTIEQFEEGEFVTVGVGNQIFEQNKQLGNQQNSFGYWNNGKVSLNTVYSSEEGYEKYGAGDTIGVGMMLDSYNDRKLYFTKNGQFIKSFEKRVHIGMDCFPGVSFTKDSKVEFTINFTGPFKFGVNSVPDYRADRSCRIGAAPTEVVAQIFYFAAETPMQVAEWQRLSKKMKEAASHNIVWKDLYLRKFPNQNPNLKIKSWMKFYKRRKDANKQTGPFGDKPVIIENCDFEFECPLIFDNLEQKDPNPQERFCNKCNKTVYQVYGEDQLKEYVTMGRCVTLYSSEGRGGPRQPRMGSSPAPRRKIPKPF